MRYFVTGATGFVGGRVVRRLRAAGHDVVAVVRTPAKAGDLAALGIALHQGDVTEKESMRAPMTGVDGVFHIAGWYTIGVRTASQRRAGEQINVEGTRNVLELMRDLDIPKGVYTSTVAVFSDTHGRMPDETYTFTGKHLSEYDRTKWIAHYEVAEPLIVQGLPLVIVQPGLIYGPGDTSAVRAVWIQYLRRKLPLVPKRTAFCWAHVDDIADGHIQAMDAGRAGESYILAGERYSFMDALALAERITGVPAPHRQASPGMLKASAALMGMVEKIVPVPESYTSEYLRINAGVTYLGDNAKARRELGYDPRPLDEGMPPTLLHEMTLLGMTPTPRT